MATTTRTLIDLARSEIDKVGNTSISDDEIKDILYKYFSSTESNFTFQKVTTGVYTYLSSKHLHLWNPTFTGDGGVDYTLHANGTIEVTTGTHSGTSITVTGASVRFYAAMAEMCLLLASRVADKPSSMTTPGASLTLSPRAELMNHASHFAQLDEMYGI